MRRVAGSLVLLSLACVVTGCAPKLDVGRWNCGEAPAKIPADGGPTVASGLPIPVPWTTSFEDGFCGYVHAGGFCYLDTEGAYQVTAAQAHSGHLAAAFAITANSAGGGQARCVREGIFPSAAYYGAWIFVPVPTVNTGNWNILHFQGGDDLHNLWDIDLLNLDDGGFSVVVRDFPNSPLGADGHPTGIIRTPSPIAEVAVATWFHLEFYLVRKTDATGEVALYVNDRVVLEVSAIITDDSTWGQWYVGNLADHLTPPDSTVYVDDVTIRDTP